jgi:GNAT superfamily N-acetyltransferase
MSVSLSWAAHGSPECEAIVELRRAVLRAPLGLVLTQEQLAQEKDQLHLGAWEGTQLLGCLLLKTGAPGEMIMRQVAVAPEAQGKGVGRLLVNESEKAVLRLGRDRMILHARESAVPFYEKLGYVIEGPGFVEVTIPHRAMSKHLKSGA